MRTRKHNPHLYNQYIKYGGCCYYCKQKIDFEYITRDHFLPRNKGNTLVNNKVFACSKCNSLKGDKNIDEFRKYLIDSLAGILKEVVRNDWKISKESLQKFKWYTSLLKTTGEIIENDYKPLYLIT